MDLYRFGFEFGIGNTAQLERGRQALTAKYAGILSAASPRSVGS